MSSNPIEQHDAIIIGAGFSGVYAVHRLRREGLKVLCIEAADDVGGVWYHNRYPGARCDVLSIDYSYSFSPELQNEWNWSERYSPQAEILAYIGHVADRFDLRRSMVFGTRVTDLTRDDTSNRWTVKTDAGRDYSAQFVVLTTGPLSTPKDPDFPEFAQYRGELNRTSRWPHHEVTFAGKNVAIIGTGSSGVQAIPEVAKTARHLTVFQRTPVFVAPARNAPLPAAELSRVRETYPEYRRDMRASFAGNFMASTGQTADAFSEAEQQAILDRFWEDGGLGIVSVFTDVLHNPAANDIVSDYVRKQIRQAVHDPATAERLSPYSYHIGTKRPCLGTGFYETFNRPNVTLVDLRETPIERMTPTGIQTSAGHHDLDMIILAIGFDALTGAIMAIDPVNGRGEHLGDLWRDGARTFLGLAIAGFPNLFTVASAGSTSVFGNVVSVGEESVDWIADCIGWMKKSGHDSIEPTPQAQDEWTDHLADVAEQTLFPNADSWYMGANIPGKKRGIAAYLGGFNTYVAKCRSVAENGYAGFTVR